MVYLLFLSLFPPHPLFLMPLPLELSCPLGFQYLFDLAIFFIPNGVTSLTLCFLGLPQLPRFLMAESHMQHLETEELCKVKAGVWLEANPL